MGATQPQKVTFVVPGRSRSGGARVSVEMAAGLLAKGHDVRIVMRAPAPLSLRGLKSAFVQRWQRLRGVTNTDWLATFDGRLESYHDELDEISFAENEVVIAAGTLVIDDVMALRQPVIKVRYCHGLIGSRPEDMRRVFAGDTPTICVAPGLIPSLEELSGGHEVLAVVPNGIHAREYYVEPGTQRDGVGTVYGAHSNKAPEVALEIFRRTLAQFPDTPRYAFGMDPRPDELSESEFWAFPSIDAARGLYNRCKVWFVASRYEGFGLPILEAMACGAAVVTTDHYGVDGLVEHGVNGLVAPIGDADQLAQHVAALLADDDLRQRLVTASQETVARFSWENAVERMEDVLKSLTTSTASHGQH
ncbi:MAG: glycosyltransferase family 4 protein [Planctomycetota bacterium]